MKEFHINFSPTKNQMKNDSWQPICNLFQKLNGFYKVETIWFSFRLSGALCDNNFVLLQIFQPMAAQQCWLPCSIVIGWKICWRIKFPSHWRWLMHWNTGKNPNGHSMLRLDATTKKKVRCKTLQIKKFSIKQSFFINEIFSSHVKVVKQKKMKVFLLFF